LFRRKAGYFSLAFLTPVDSFFLDSSAVLTFLIFPVHLVDEVSLSPFRQRFLSDLSFPLALASARNLFLVDLDLIPFFFLSAFFCI